MSKKHIFEVWGRKGSLADWCRWLDLNYNRAYYFFIKKGNSFKDSIREDVRCIRAICKIERDEEDELIKNKFKGSYLFYNAYPIVKKYFPWVRPEYSYNSIDRDGIIFFNPHNREKYFIDKMSFYEAMRENKKKDFIKNLKPEPMNHRSNYIDYEAKEVSCYPYEYGNYDIPSGCNGYKINFYDTNNKEIPPLLKISLINQQIR